MISTLTITKILLTVVTILGLAMIAERTNPQIAGILSGYPLGTALVLFFYGIEIGPQFASAAVPYNLVGHLSAQSFAYFYFLSSRTATIRSLLVASLTAFAGYSLIAAVMSRVNHTIVKRVPLTPAAMLLRVAISASIVLLITGIAQWVGPNLAGIFSAFPLVVYPLVLLVHLNHGVDSARTVLKNFPRGLWTVLLYSITVYFTYPALGVYLGTVIAYIVATLGLLAINWRIFLNGLKVKSINEELRSLSRPSSTRAKT
jgi:hypothetical protein